VINQSPPLLKFYKRWAIAVDQARQKSFTIRSFSLDMLDNSLG
jgi:hypothetical protein